MQRPSTFFNWATTKIPLGRKKLTPTSYQTFLDILNTSDVAKKIVYSLVTGPKTNSTSKKRPVTVPSYIREICGKLKESGFVETTAKGYRHTKKGLDALRQLEATAKRTPSGVGNVPSVDSTTITDRTNPTNHTLQESAPLSIAPKVNEELQRRRLSYEPIARIFYENNATHNLFDAVNSGTTATSDRTRRGAPKRK